MNANYQQLKLCIIAHLLPQVVSYIKGQKEMFYMESKKKRRKIRLLASLKHLYALRKKQIKSYNTSTLLFIINKKTRTTHKLCLKNKIYILS